MNEKKTFKEWIANYFWPVCSGLLLTLSFSGGIAASAAFFALVPLLFSIRNEAPKQALGKGFAAGFVHSMTLYTWVVYTMHVYGYLSYIYCVPVLVLLATYLACYSAAVSFAASYFRARPFVMALFFAVAWICGDYARGVLFTGFPWAFLGYSQHQNLVMIQAADLGGVYIVTFAAVLFNGFLFWSASTVADTVKSGRRIPGIKAFGAFSVFVVFFAFYVHYGYSRMNEVGKNESNAEKSKIAMIQGNIDQSVKWEPSYQIFTIEKYMAMTRRIAVTNPDFVIWPETAAPFYFMYDKILTRSFLNSVRETGMDIVFGSPRVVFNGETPQYFNSVYSMDREGRILGRYDKTHLVPFGEYTPLKEWLPFIGKMVPLEGDFSTGEPGKLIDTATLKLGVQICYEIIFPGLSRLMVANGADIIVNVTNDAWFGKTGAPVQHFASSVFRAVENRKAMVRAANTGYSALVLPSGAVDSKTGLFKDEIRLWYVPVMKEASYYTRHGDVFVAGCFLIMAALFAGVFFIKKTSKD